jgi:hypothetical protein
MLAERRTDNRATGATGRGMDFQHRRVNFS